MESLNSIGWIVAMFLLGSVSGPMVGRMIKCLLCKVKLLKCCKKEAE